MHELDSILRDATQSIEKGYFRLPIDGGPAVFRERVYCYELYHQMRSRWPRGCAFVLNGEVDKAGHPILREREADMFKPDLLVHGPGDMGRNHAIIEVKQSGGQQEDFGKDFGTLVRFLQVVGYERAILLTFGHISEAVEQRIQRAAAEVPGSECVERWMHREVGQPAMRLHEDRLLRANVIV